MARAKTIQLLLNDGTLNGLLLVRDNSWNGIMLASPRESIADLLARDDVKRYGVYILLSENQVYVGQASDLKKRIYQHYGTNGKDWWTRAVLFTTKDDSFNRSDIDFLENKLIEIANNVQTLHSDNKVNGNQAKVDEFRETELVQYLENSLLLLELIGIKVFAPKKKAKRKVTASSVLSAKRTQNTKTPTKLAERDYSKLVGHTYYMSGKSKETGVEYSASVYFESETRAILKAGSTIKELSNHWNKYVEQVDNAQKLHSANLNGFEVTKDIKFPNHNQAATFVFGQAVNAWDYYKDADGNSIDAISRR
jgi:hypothetical protein